MWNYSMFPRALAVGLTTSAGAGGESRALSPSILLPMVMKVADVSHFTRPAAVHMRWVLGLQAVRRCRLTSS